MNQGAGRFKAVQIPDADTSSINFLYNTIPGRVLLRLLVRTTVSKFAGLILRSPVSRLMVNGFIKRNDINTDEYQDAKYKSFDDFFIRRVKTGCRSFPDCENDVAAPSDGKLTVHPVSADTVFSIKHSMYSVSELLQDNNLANEFNDGICLIFRLSPDDYHRYSYIDDGDVLRQKRINGRLHTVRPIAYQQCNVFCRNSREYIVMQTTNFGKIVQMEVGALFVGRISNHNNDRTVKRGDEKGMFQFGGSTVIMLFQKNSITVDDEIYDNTKQNLETIVKMGDKIGEKK